MGIFSLILLVYLSYRNSVRAKQKSQNGLVWAIITGIAFFFAEMLGVLIVVLYFLRGIVDFNRLALDPAYKDVATRQLTDAFAQNPLHSITVDLFGLGGYLLVRYILDRKPDKNGPEVHNNVPM